ncbi:MAG: hypothetical protein CMM01_15430, partial [Rhodopirellula sp.]|nr:hypothetical protein [Rhodopirellula sp.]
FKHTLIQAHTHSSTHSFKHTLIQAHTHSSTRAQLGYPAEIHLVQCWDHSCNAGITRAMLG